MHLLEWLVALLLVTGGGFILIGAFGMVKLPDLYTRLHAPTKATTLGIGCILMASILMRLGRSEGFGIQELVISLFLFITAPVSAYMIAKAAIHLRVPLRPDSRNSALLEQARDQQPPL